MGFYGKFYTTRQRYFRVVYYKQDRNFLPSYFFDDTTMLDSVRFSEIQLDTRSSPYTVTYRQSTSGVMFPSNEELTGQDIVPVVVSIWYSPGTELTVTTNIPLFESITVTTEATTSKVEIEGMGKLTYFTVKHTPGALTVSHPSLDPFTGEHVTLLSLSWPRLHLDSTHIQFTVETAPHMKMEGRLGWDCFNIQNKTIYLEVKGSIPEGDFLVQSNGDYEISGTQYKLSWTQKEVFPKGLQTTFSTIGTYLVATVHTALSEEANVVVV